MGYKEIKKKVKQQLDKEFQRKGVDFTFKTKRLAPRIGLSSQAVGHALSQIVEEGGPVDLYSQRSKNRVWVTTFKKNK